MSGPNQTVKKILIWVGAGILIVLANVAFLIVRDSVYDTIVSANQRRAAAAVKEETAAQGAAAESAAPPAAQTTAPPPVASDVPRILEVYMINGSLTIETGLFFNVKYDSSLIQVENTGEVLSIRDTDSGAGINERLRMDVTVTVPEETSFDSVDVALGAGKLLVMTLLTKELKLECGAGSATLNGLLVTGSADIRCGAGALSVGNSMINGLRLQCGAGTTQIRAALTGENRINASMGEVDVLLYGTPGNYTVSFDMNLGVCYYNGVRRSRNASFGSGQNRVELTGGFGVVRVNTDGN